MKNQELATLDDSDLSIEVTNHPSGMPDLMEFWKAQSQHFNSDPDFFLSVIACRETVLSPLIFLVREGGVPVTVLICRLEMALLPARVAYFTLAQFSLRSITVIYNGLVGKDTATIRSKLLDALSHELNVGSADRVTFSMLRENSALAKSIEACHLARWRLMTSLPQEHFILQVPDAPEDILLKKSSKRRKKIKYSMRRADDTLTNLRIDKFDGTGSLENLMMSLESVASKTYQRGLGAGFKYNSEWRAILDLGIRKKWIEIWTLLTDEKVISFIIGIKYKRRYLIYAKAFDPAYSDKSVGTYLQIKILEEVARRGDCELIDYGFGDADYKRQFSTESWSEVNVFVAKASFRNFIIINSVRLCMASDRVLRMIAQKMTLTKRIKTALRNKKAKSAQERKQD